jgi:hypothetical protein
MAEEVNESEKKKEDWMNSKWRPMMGWMYMGVCIFDFVLAPVLWSTAQAIFHGGVNVQWQPLTLQGAGLFHISMGAVLGLAAYGRTQEKLAGANNGGINLPSGVGTTYTAPGPVQQPVASGFNPAGSNSIGGGGVGSTPLSTGATQPAWTTPTVAPAEVTVGFGGKAAPPTPSFPAI